MKTINNYYGFLHNWGSNTHVQNAPHGDGGTVYVFGSKKARDEWVDNAPYYVGDRERTAYPAVKVRGHVTVGMWGEGEMTTRDLVDLAAKEARVEDCR